LKFIYVLGSFLGSINILGNPAGLLSDLGTGVNDFFEMPL